jgi:hypothetical protein
MPVSHKQDCDNLCHAGTAIKSVAEEVSEKLSLGM